MSSKIPAFTVFKKEVFDKLSDKEKNQLFYWSSFDPSAWEEKTPDYAPAFSRGEKRVLSILKKSITCKKFINKDKDFCKRFVWSEFLTNYLLGIQIEKDMKNNGFAGKVDKNLKKTSFPDIIIKDTKLGKIPVEIKTAISGLNLKDRIKNEVIEGINEYNKKNSNKYKKFLLILLFPLCLKDNHRRINQLVKGYYVYEDIIKCYAKVNCKALCHCVGEKYNKGYSIDNLGERIFKSIKKLVSP